MNDRLASRVRTRRAMSERLICSDCGLECNVKRVDFGIGPYEYWGHRGVDVQMRDCSDCCEADLKLYDGSEE
jgi:hypothetical protein